MAVRIQLFGNSFVSGLKCFIRTDEQFKYNFNLQQPALVQYTGSRTSLYQNVLGAVVSAANTFAILLFISILSNTM